MVRRALTASKKASLFGAMLPFVLVNVRDFGCWECETIEDNLELAGRIVVRVTVVGRVKRLASEMAI